MAWLKQELEQSKMTRHHQFAFVDCDPISLPRWFLRFLAKGRVLCLFGITSGNAYEEVVIVEQNEDAENGSDEESISSLGSGIKEDEPFRMKIVGRGDSSLKCVNLEEYGAWNFENL
jgi:hypothetical protein